MKLSYRARAFAMALVWCIAASGSLASAAPMPKEKEKEPEGTKVDSGSFGVFQNGHRVGTETFSIYQTDNGSVVKSVFKTENTPPDVQTSEMQLDAKGELRRYEWKELSPEKAESVVLPNNDFLTQQWSAGPQEKAHEQPYLLPASTSILDDYFFVHREILAWKFLAAACKQEKGQAPECPVKQRTQFGTMDPHQHSSAALSAEFLGVEKVSLKSGQQDLIKLEFKTEAGTWQLWLDAHDPLKVMRMSIVGETTEVERD